ncbi:hypothetical protein EDD29_6644 [Actinocorallia herbida]|uniref:Fibronectin type-III domain-containing protein n=1 Tax=Actinocorallia herbida TaxID=58109 RepID=A0A3N1D5Z6_9ACTN|nr:fibronectin type III domain-containing protein [Actinocorallia herbida]ROO88957.1 hypothetical protein EDD29_6644 [Actinocorallia herbida]
MTADKLTLDTAPIGATARAGVPCALPLATGIQLGGTDDAETVTRLRVDLSQVPVGAEIVSTTLTLTGCAGDCAASRQITVHQIEPMTVPATGPLVVSAGLADALGQGPANGAAIQLGSALDDRAAAADTGVLLRSPGTGSTSFTGLSLTIGYAVAEAPGGVSSVSARPGDGGVLASWEIEEAIDAESYEVEILDPGGALVETATTMDTSVIIDGLTNGQAYGVRVRGVNPAGPGPWTTTSAPVTAVAAPGGVQDFVDAVQQFGEAQQGLVDGTFADVAAALTASAQSSLFSSALAVTGDPLLAEKAELVLQGIDRESDVPTVEEALVSYDAAANRVTVRAVLSTRTTDTYTDSTYIDPDTVGPAEAVTEETVTVDYVFALPATTQPFSASLLTGPTLTVLKDGAAVDAVDTSANAVVASVAEDNTM